QFTATTATNTTAVVNQAITVGEIDFGSSQSYTLSSSGGSALTLQNSSGDAVLNVGASPFTNSGTDTISAPLTVSSNLTRTVSGGTVRLTNTAAGAAANTITGTFTVNSGGTLEGLAASGTGSNALGTAAVTLGGGTLRLTPALTDSVPS